MLVEVSTNGGATYYNRMRIRGSTSNNSFWAYSATAVAELPHLPQTEVVFQPNTSGLQTTQGYSTGRINFPSSVSQVRIRMTGRSSSSSDTWLVDNVMLLGYTSCPATSSSSTVEICQGQSHFVQGANQTTSGTYYDTLAGANAAGCDSVLITQLIVQPLPVGPTQQVSICVGDSHFVQGAYQKVSGMYYDTLAGQQCDSVVPTQLVVNPIAMGPAQIVEICEGDSHLAQGSYQTMSGIYYDTLVSAVGCDSVVMTDLTVHPTVFGPTFQVDICAGDSHLVNGIYQTTSGTYYDSLLSVENCDSILTTQLTVTQLVTSTTLTSGTLSADAAGLSYQWIDCDADNAPIAGETGQDFKPSSTGRYAVALSDGTCSDTSACTEVVPVGLAGGLANRNIQMYPVPANEQVTLDLGMISGPVKLSLIHSNGALIREYTSDPVSNYVLPVGDLPNGWYLLRIEAEGQQHVMRLPVVH